MLENLKSITEKITIINNNKLNKFNYSKYIPLLCVSPLITLFFAYNIGIMVLLIPIFCLILTLIISFTSFLEKTINYFNKKEFFKLLNKEEKKLLEKSKIDFSLFDIKETLFEIQKLCIDNVSSEKELKDILFFILNNNDKDEGIELKKKSCLIKIIEYIKENKYCNTSFIDLIYEKS